MNTLEPVSWIRPARLPGSLAPGPNSSASVAVEGWIGDLLHGFDVQAAAQEVVDLLDDRAGVLQGLVVADVNHPETVVFPEELIDLVKKKFTEQPA